MLEPLEKRTKKGRADKETNGRRHMNNLMVDLDQIRMLGMADDKAPDTRPWLMQVFFPASGTNYDYLYGAIIVAA